MCDGNASLRSQLRGRRRSARRRRTRVDACRTTRHRDAWCSPADATDGTRTTATTRTRRRLAADCGREANVCGAFIAGRTLRPLSSPPPLRWWCLPRDHSGEFPRAISAAQPNGREHALRATRETTAVPSGAKYENTNIISHVRLWWSNFSFDFWKNYFGQKEAVSQFLMIIVIHSITVHSRTCMNMKKITLYFQPIFFFLQK